jgi:hypothetical protein
VSLQEGRGSLVGSGLAAQDGDITVDKVAIELFRRCSARELSWFKTVDEDRETSQNRKAVATEGLGQGTQGGVVAGSGDSSSSSGEHGIQQQLCCVLRRRHLGKEEKRKR